MKNMDEKIITKIDETIKSIWKNEIADDYKNHWLLKEDTLKNAFYFHLRNQLGVLLSNNNIRIFTEFTDDKFGGTNFRPDIVIAEMDFNRHSEYFGDDVKKCLAVIELKYKNRTTPAKTILNDYDKLHKYVKELKINCNLYMATIWEREDEETYWEDENSEWAIDRLTELNASYKPDSQEMRFYIIEH